MHSILLYGITTMYIFMSLPPSFLHMQRYVPNFPTMFSSLRHYPRQGVTLDTTDPVPTHIPRQWRGYTEQARETLIRYKKSVHMHHHTSIGLTFACGCVDSLSLYLSPSLSQVQL